MRRATPMPSPASMIPAPSPGPTSTWAASVGSRRKWILDDLYEQCSLHMTAYMASSRWLGDRPRMLSMDAASASVSPSSRWMAWPMRTPYPPSRRAKYHATEPCNTDEMPSKPKRTKTPMSDQHKEALAIGRDQGRAVRRYLEALEAHKPKRGRKRTSESIQKRLVAIEDRLPTADPLTRVNLLQERMDLQDELASKDAVVDLSALE